MRLLSSLTEMVIMSLLGETIASYSPRQVMVDLTNDFGICVLQAVASRRENVAFSPYGLVSVGVVLYEGSRGPTAAEIHNTLKLPWDRQVTRIGFRDLHRHLKSYFTNDGFLRGLVLSKPNVRLRTSYLKLLRFYGFYTNLDATTTVKPETTVPMQTETPTTPAVTVTMRVETTTMAMPAITIQQTTANPTTMDQTETVTEKTELTSTVGPLLTNSKEPNSEGMVSTPAITQQTTSEDTTVVPASTIGSEGSTSNSQPLTDMSQLLSESMAEVTSTIMSTMREETEDVTLITEITKDMPGLQSQVSTTKETFPTEGSTSPTTLNTDRSTETSIPTTESPTTETDKKTTLFEVSIAKTTVNSSSTTFDPNLSTTESAFPTEDYSRGTSDVPSTVKSEPAATEAETTVAEGSTTQMTVLIEEEGRETTAAEDSVPTAGVTTSVEESTESEDQGSPTLTTNSSEDGEKPTTLLETSDPETSNNAVGVRSNDSLPTRMPRSLDTLRLTPDHREGNVANWILRGQGPHWSFTIPTDQWFFTFNGGESVPVLTYTAYLPFAFLPDINALALQLPLDDPRYSMLILLPEERLALESLLESLTWCSLTAILAALKTTAVYAVIPSFTTVKHINLGPPLAQLGVRSLFDPFRADLREMSPEKHVFVRTIEQVVTVSLRKYYHNHRWFDATPNDVQQHFIANHPFAYFVLDKETNVALMAGTIVNPVTKQSY